MKSIKHVLKFELGNYFGSKSWIISTILISLLCVGIMFVPRVIAGFKDDDKEETADTVKEEDMSTYAFYDAAGVMDMELLDAYYTDVKITICDQPEDVKKMVEAEDAEMGFVVTSLTSYDYYVYNKEIFADYQSRFNDYLSTVAKYAYCEENNLNPEEFFALDAINISANETILGKDSSQNYWYCYVLVIVVFMIIVMYGTLIATSVANEKGNRSIEIMVTSTSSTSLLFGKVFASAIATFFQVGLIALSLLGSYQINKEYFGDGISSFLNIPSDVLTAFAVFGLGGFLIYAFMYGALGALVSKVEDLNKSAGTAQMLVMIVYFVVLLQLTNIDGIAMKICSFLPISSYSAMFARVAMGSVETWEIIVSAVILYASVIGMGFLGGKIFRNSTLRYGNPIKLTNALKDLRKK